MTEIELNQMHVGYSISADMFRPRLRHICISNKMFLYILVTQAQHNSGLHFGDRFSCLRAPWGYAVLKATISKTFSADILFPLPKTSSYVRLGEAQSVRYSLSICLSIRPLVSNQVEGFLSAL